MGEIKKMLSYKQLKKHIGHNLVLWCKGTEEERIEQNPESISLKCEDCNETLITCKRR